MRTRTSIGGGAATRFIGHARHLHTGQLGEVWLNTCTRRPDLFVVEWQRDERQDVPTFPPASPPLAPGRPDNLEWRWVLAYVALWALLILVIGVSAAAVAQILLALS